eukprot:251479_1
MAKDVSVSTKDFVGEYGDKLKAMDAEYGQNRWSEIEKNVKNIQNVVTTPKWQRGVNGVRALSKGLKDNWSKLQSDDSCDRFVGIMNICEGIASAAPPPYNAIAAPFGIISDVIQIIQDKPSELELIGKMIDHQTEALKTAINVQTIKIEQSIKEEISEDTIEKAYGQLHAAWTHLNRDYLSCKGTLPQEKINNITRAMAPRTAMLGTLRKKIECFGSAINNKMEVIDVESKHEKDDQDELDKATKKLDDLNKAKKVLDDSLVGKLTNAVPFLPMIKQALEDKEIDKAQASKDKFESKVANEDQELQADIVYRNMCVEIHSKLLDVFVTLSVLDQIIAYLVSFKIIDQTPDENAVYFNTINMKYKEDHDFFRQNKIGCFQIESNRRGLLYHYEEAIDEYDNLSGDYAKVLMSNGTIVKHYGAEKWVKWCSNRATERYTNERTQIRKYQSMCNVQRMIGQKCALDPDFARELDKKGQCWMIEKSALITRVAMDEKNDQPKEITVKDEDTGYEVVLSYNEFCQKLQAPPDLWYNPLV